jgi:tetratricopeptide (TPR) repeat protein
MIAAMQKPIELLDPGTLVGGRYCIRERLGQGGMGVVYEAWDEELRRTVALKVLQHGEGGRERLLREAQAMAKVSDHPNVVTVHDFGTHEGQVFLVMDRLYGGTLTQWLAKQRRSWREVVARFVEAGRGLQAAHRAGLVHRDFKPDNVMLDRDDRAQVTDFGLAQDLQPVPDPAEGEGAAGGPRRVRQGKVLEGTLLYMAPELFTYEGRADAQSDQFAYCVAFYEALYGQLPFDDQSTQKFILDASDGRVRPPPPGRRVPRWLRRVVLRGLSARPEARYPSMEALLGDLDRLPRQARRRRLAGLVAVVVAAAAGLGYRAARPPLCRGFAAHLAGAWDEARRREVRAAFRRVPRPYVEEALRGVEQVLDAYARGWVRMRTEACQATHERGVQSAALLDLRIQCLDRRLREAGALVGQLAQADEQGVQKAVEAAGGLVPLSGCADAAALQAVVPPPATEQARRQVGEVQAHLAQAEALRALGKYRPALEEAGRAARQAEGLKYAPLVAEALVLRGRLEERSGKAAEAEQTLFQAGVAAMAGEHRRAAAQAWTYLAYVQGYLLGSAAQGARWAEMAWARLGEERESEEWAGLHITQGLLAHREKRFDAAKAHFARALGIRRAIYGQEHPRISDVLRNLAMVHQDEREVIPKNEGYAGGLGL